MQLTNNIKKTFLSFAQQYFKNVHPTLTWNADVRLTKIFIADKNVSAPAIIEKMPSIILARGPVTYAQTSIDQAQYIDNVALPQAKQRTDLVRASITYNCTSQNGIEAEEIANTLYLNLVGFKDQFRSNGIHQIMGISMGEEQIVRGDVVPRLFMVPVNVIFTVQTTIVTADDLYTAVVYTNDNLTAQVPGSENLNTTANMFGYVASGNTLTFSYPPGSGSSLKVNYTGKYSLTDYTNVTPAGICDGVNIIFTLPEDIYTPYTTYSGLLIYASGFTN